MVQVPSCPLCAGKRPFCIHKSYPFPSRDLESQVKEKLKKDFFGPTYSVFVGRYGYPDVLAGPMVGLEPKQSLDAPGSWWGMPYQDIVTLRSFLLRSKKPESIHGRTRFVEDMQELSLAKRPTDVEMNFKSLPSFSFRLSESFQPMGPSASMDTMRVTENVAIKTRVDKIVSDDLLATDQTFQLYRTGIDVYQLSSIFAAGTLGQEQTKKLVPSRWSVTAIDDIIAKQLLHQVRTYPSVEDYQVFEAQYLDNHFVILLMPGNWEYENFEVWAPGSNWSIPTQSRIIEEYESFEGRSTYAAGQAGAYYAVRLGVVEYLKSIKKQARAMVFREVAEGYSVPMGVFVVRETVRNAFKRSGEKFLEKQEALAHIKTRLRIPLPVYMKQSKMLQQARLGDFLKRR